MNKREKAAMDRAFEDIPLGDLLIFVEQSLLHYSSMGEILEKEGVQKIINDTFETEDMLFFTQLLTLKKVLKPDSVKRAFKSLLGKDSTLLEDIDRINITSGEENNGKK